MNLANKMRIDAIGQIRQRFECAQRQTQLQWRRLKTGAI